MNNESPEPEPGCPADCTAHAQTLWQTTGGASVSAGEDEEENIFTVDMNDVLTFVECKAMFASESFAADQRIHLHIFLRTSCPAEIGFSKLSLIFNNPVYNNYCVITSGSDTNPDFLQVKPGEVNKYTITFLPQPKDVGKQIQITSMALELGGEQTRCAVLHWNYDVITSLTNQNTYEMQYKEGDAVLWDKIPMVPSTGISSRSALIHVQLEHSPPSLVNEYYVIQLTMRNHEQNTITDISLSAGLCDTSDHNLEQTTHVCVDKAEFENKVISRRIGLNLADLAQQQTLTKTIYVKNLQTGSRIIMVKITYNVSVRTDEDSITCECCHLERISLTTVTPFDINVKLNSMKFETLESVHADEPFLLLSEISVTSPWKLDFKSSQLKLSPYVQNTDDNIKSYIEGLRLQKDECAAECYSLLVPPAIQQSIPLGIYTLLWRRESDSDCAPYVSTTLTLPSIDVEHTPLYIDCDLPSHGSVRVCLPLNYTLYNRTAFVQDVEISMDNSECFMYAGYKQFHFQILPSSQYPLTFNLFPLLTGYLELPKLRLNLVRYPGTMTDLVQKMIPSHIFIKPCGKELQPTLV